MKRTWRAHIFIVSFLLIQLLLPLRGLLDPSSRRSQELVREFSWNMYAYSLQHEVRYDLLTPDGKTLRIGIETEFNVPQEYFRVFRRDRLPHFHAYLCDQMKRRGLEGRVIADLRTTPRESPPRRLVSQDVDICAAENFGVLAE